jgi:hypothetical protein
MNINDVKYTVQEMGNKSFDDQLKVNMVEIIGADGVLKNPATEAKQDDIIANQNPLAGYVLQAIDDYTTTSVTYFCKMKPDGTWLTMKISEVGNYPTFTYANVSNNAGLTYATAFTNRVTLTYGLLNTLTL